MRKGQAVRALHPLRALAIGHHQQRNTFRTSLLPKLAWCTSVQFLVYFSTNALFNCCFFLFLCLPLPPYLAQRRGHLKVCRLRSYHRPRTVRGASSIHMSQTSASTPIPKSTGLVRDSPSYLHYRGRKSALCLDHQHLLLSGHRPS